MEYLLGIDIGTSSLKSMLMDTSGTIIAVAVKDYQFDIPAAGYAEQDPQIWWDAFKNTVREILTQPDVSKDKIKGIGFSGQMHGMVALDKNRRPLRKAILHCDMRSKQQCEYIETMFPDKEWSKITLNPVFPGMQIVSLLWMRENEPELFDRVAHVLCVKDYIRMLLTGELGAERTDASATLAYDNNKQCWASDALEKLSIDKKLFPEENNTPYDKTGVVSKYAAEETGLAAGTPVAYGGGDQTMQSIGNGLFKPGSMTSTIGTSGQILLITQKPVYNPALNTHVFCHAAPDTWFSMAAILSAGIALNWFRRNFTPELTYAQMSTLAQDINSGSEGLVFFPAMMGERTPYLDADTRGMFIGSSFMHTKAHFIRAIMEGIIFQMKTGMDIITDLHGEPEFIVAAGGAARSSVWLQIQADIYNKIICVKSTEEQACKGAAIMAGIACGVYDDLEEGCRKTVSTEVRYIKPNPKNVSIYTELYYDVYQHLYDNNKGLMHSLAAFGFRNKNH